ncbi:MAG: UDP-N-acetylglucosamine 2-epimerase (non-hydrolyzing) [Candidatus Poseidoniales archaeon]
MIEHQFQCKHDMLLCPRISMPQPIHVVVGARPNQMKAAPLLRALREHPDFDPILVDTGQHYDHEMAGIFMQQFGMGKPDFALEVGSGTHGAQTAKILERYEALLLENPPAACVVIGDINSTVACALAAAKLGIPVVHLEAGLRSWDRGMPEELNRIVTDHLADLLWTPSPDGDENLLASGIEASKIVRVGNIMIDTLVAMKPAVESSQFLETISFAHDSHAMVTLHRPSNVDDPATLDILLNELLNVAQKMDLIWPLHPRTKARIERLGRMDELLANKAIHLMGPLGYIDFMNGIMHSKCVITDSGGIQEETTWLRVPCITLRPNTERPITITQGTNVLATPGTLQVELERIEQHYEPHQTEIEFWDGKTAQRCVQSLEQFLKR